MKGELFMFKKFALGLCLFMSGIMFTCKVLVPIEDYFKEPGLPTLVNNPSIPDCSYVVIYQYWNNVKHNWYNEEKAVKYVTEEIDRNLNDPRLTDIYLNMKKDQNISILKNNKNNNIYVFTNSQEHISEITVYSDDGENLNQKEKIVISHPNYRVGYGEYDEKNKKIYLGVIRKRWDEGDFGGEWVDGETVIDLND